MQNLVAISCHCPAQPHGASLFTLFYIMSFIFWIMTYHMIKTSDFKKLKQVFEYKFMNNMIA